MGLKEIARLTGYSVSTVSRVLNGRCKCASTKTEQEIWAAAQELHYSRNDHAANLRTGKSSRSKAVYRIGIVMARGSESLEDEFYFQIEKSAKAAILRAGHQLGKTFMLDAVLQNIGCLADISGLILLGKCEVQNLKLLRSACEYLVCTGLNPYHMDIDQVYCNSERIAEAAVQYFASRGHERIGYVGECDGDVRYRGYQKGLENAGLKTVPSFVFEVSQTMEGGRAAAREYMTHENPPTAIFCVNDVSAIGLIEILKQAKPDIPIPAVMGVGDISYATDFQPSLTTAQIPLAEMGSISAQILLARMNRQLLLPIKVELPHKIVYRQSS